MPFEEYPLKKRNVFDIHSAKTFHGDKIPLCFTVCELFSLFHTTLFEKKRPTFFIQTRHIKFQKSSNVDNFVSQRSLGNIQFFQLDKLHYVLMFHFSICALLKIFVVESCSKKIHSARKHAVKGEKYRKCNRIRGHSK